MITFKSFLTESKSAPLYHATLKYQANKILYDNTMFATLQDNGRTAGKRVIFFTRDFRHAKHIHGNDSVIFEFDQNKLNQRYKIKPIKNWDKADKNHKPLYMNSGWGGNEFEEIIETTKITDIDKYIKTIYVSGKIDKFQYPELFADERVTYI